MLNTIGIVGLAALAANADPLVAGDHIDGTAHKIAGQGREPFVVVIRPAIFDRDILPFDKASLFEPPGGRLLRKARRARRDGC